MFLIQYNQSFSTALEGLLKNVKLDAVGGVKRNIREKRASGHRARIVSVIRLKRFPVVKLKRGFHPDLSEERYWWTLDRKLLVDSIPIVSVRINY